jgi:hypothetical protein
MSVIDIGYILLDTINSKTDLNKIKLINAIETYKKNMKDEKENEITNRNRYITNYENKRKKNEDNYNLYLRENKLLYNKWLQSKKTKELYEYVSHKKPYYEEIDDIYTINPISLH